MDTLMALESDAIAQKADINSLKVSPFYFSAVNALTQPNQAVFCSRYFVRRWMPLLGGTGTQIVLYLRSLGFYNRQTGELRNEIAIGIRDIATNCGCSVNTVRREFASNETLQLFVQIRQRWQPDPSTGQMRQSENGYCVAMDDPVHDDDKEWVETYIAEEEGRGNQQFSQSRSAIQTPPSQNGTHPLSKWDPPPPKMGVLRKKILRLRDSVLKR